MSICWRRIYAIHHTIRKCPALSVNHSLQPAACRSQAADCRLQATDCRLQTPDHRLQTAGCCRLCTTDHLLQTTDCRQQTTCCTHHFNDPVRCGTQRHNAERCGTLQHGTAQCDEMRCDVMRHPSASCDDLSQRCTHVALHPMPSHSARSDSHRPRRAERVATVHASAARLSTSAWPWRRDPLGVSGRGLMARASLDFSTTALPSCLFSRVTDQVCGV